MLLLLRLFSGDARDWLQMKLQDSVAILCGWLGITDPVAISVATGVMVVAAFWWAVYLLTRVVAFLIEANKGGR